MTTSGGAGTTLRSANTSTFSDVLYTPASVIGSELSVYLAPAFIMRVLLAALYRGTGSSSTNAAFALPRPDALSPLSPGAVSTYTNS
jgi:hypothetical protein